jgi:hypothetical protein
MVSEGMPDKDRSRTCTPAATTGEAERLTRRDLLILRLKVARQRRAVRYAAARRRLGRPARLAG